MSWVYVPASEDLNSASASPCPERAASLTWRGKPMPSQTLLREWKRANFIRRLSGLTLPPSTLDRGVASWIASLRETPASPTPSPESAKARTMTDSCLIRSSGSSRSAGLVVSSARTCRGTPTDSFACSSRHWSDWAIALRQEYSARPKWGRAIDESDCSSWPTSTVGDANASGNRPDKSLLSLTDVVVRQQWASPKTPSGGANSKRKERGAGGPDLQEQVNHWQTPNVPNGGRSASHAEMIGRTAMHNGRKVQIGLEHQVRSWATPRAEDSESSGIRHSRGVADTLTGQAYLWPTPAARDHKGANSQEHVTTNGTGRMHMDQLPNFVEHAFRCSPPAPQTPSGETSSPPPRSLNPRFVEWLMGWPTGWTDLGQQETGLSHWLRLSRGALLRLVSPPPTATEQGDLFA